MCDVVSCVPCVGCVIKLACSHRGADRRGISEHTLKSSTAGARYKKKSSGAKTRSHLPLVTTEQRMGNGEVILRACFDGIHGIAG